MPTDFERNLREYIEWYEEHKNDSHDLERRVQILETALKNVNNVLVDIAEEMQSSNGRSPLLFTPRGVRLV